MTGSTLRFDWDSEKAKSNLAKHDIAFDLAKRVWDDPLHVIVPDRVEDGELRWHAIGVVGTVLLVVVVHTYLDAEEQHIGSSVPEGRPGRNGSDMKKKPFSRSERDQIARLEKRRDTDIDTADIPEAPAENWIYARRGEFYRPRKQAVTIRLDSDLVAWFKDRAADGGYQTEINRVLRRHVTDVEKPAERRRPSRKVRSA